MPGSVFISLPISFSKKISPLNLGNYTAQLKSSNDPNQLRTGKAIDEIQTMVNSLVKANQATNQIAVPSVINIQEVNLTADTLINPNVVPVVNQALVVFVTQDTTGGHKITWSPQFIDAPVSVDQTAKNITQFLFIGRTGPGNSQAAWFYQSMWPEVLDQAIVLAADTVVKAQFQASSGKAMEINIAQDGTGSHAITWDPNSFDPTSSVSIPTAPNQQTRFLFVGRLDAAQIPVALTGAYSSGSGLLNVPATAPAIPVPLPFVLTLTDPSTGVTLVTLQITGINSGTQYAVTAVGSDANAPIGSQVNFQARWYPLAGLTPNGTVVGGEVIAQIVNFGLATDAVGTNAASRYAVVLTKSTPVAGWYTVVTPSPNGPPTNDSQFDILFSTDNGATWTTIFTNSGANIIIPQLTASPGDFNANPRQKKFAGTDAPSGYLWSGTPVFPVGTILRVDSLQAGGAANILLVLELAPSK